MICKTKTLHQAHLRKIKAQARIKRRRAQRAQFHQVLESKRVMIKKKVLLKPVKKRLKSKKLRSQAKIFLSAAFVGTMNLT